MRAPTAALAELPPSLETETRLAAVRSDIDGHRRLAAQVRAEAQALAREANWPTAGVQAILAERNEWQTRKEAPPRRSPPSRPASPRSRPNAPNSKMRRRSSPRSAAR